MNKKEKSIEELLELAKKNDKKLNIKPRQFERTEDGKLLMNPDKKFDKDWYENDEAYDIL
jgi:hypothetical protein